MSNAQTDRFETLLSDYLHKYAHINMQLETST